jgi:hypothetical protein
MGARNRVGIGLSYRPTNLHRLAGRYYNPLPTQFLAPIDCSEIPSLLLLGLPEQQNIIEQPAKPVEVLCFFAFN